MYQNIPILREFGFDAINILRLFHFVKNFDESIKSTSLVDRYFFNTIIVVGMTVL